MIMMIYNGQEMLHLPRSMLDVLLAIHDKQFRVNLGCIWSIWLHVAIARETQVSVQYNLHLLQESHAVKHDLS